MFTPVDIESWIKYHKPNEKGIERIALMRAAAAWFADELSRHVPEGREQALSMTKLEEALMWANAGIAREPMYQDLEG